VAETGLQDEWSATYELRQKEYFMKRGILCLTVSMHALRDFYTDGALCKRFAWARCTCSRVG